MFIKALIRPSSTIRRIRFRIPSIPGTLSSLGLLIALRTSYSIITSSINRGSRYIVLSISLRLIAGGRGKKVLRRTSTLPSNQSIFLSPSLVFSTRNLGSYFGSILLSLPYFVINQIFIAIYTLSRKQSVFAFLIILSLLLQASYKASSIYLILQALYSLLRTFTTSVAILYSSFQNDFVRVNGFAYNIV